MRTEVGSTQVDSCLRCRGAVEVITVHRAERFSWAAEYKAALALPFTPEGAISLVATGAVLGVLHWVFVSMPSAIVVLQVLAALLWLGLGFAWFFHVIRATSQGGDPFSPPDFRDLSSDVVMPAARALFALSFVWGIPVWLAGHALIAETTLGFGRLGTTAFVVYAWAYAPIALLLAAIDTAGWSLQPISGAAFAFRLGRDYLRLLFAVVPLAALEAALLRLGGTGLFGRIPVVGPWLLQTLLLYPAFGFAYLLGRLLSARGDRLGHGRAEDYRVPVLGSVTPRG